MMPDTEQPAAPVSLEAGLRPIRRARLRTWGLYGLDVLALLCACPLSFQIDTPWKFLLMPGLPALLILIGSFQADGLLCPRCGRLFFGHRFEHRGIFLLSACRYCGLRL
jgi:hypothetical protein